LSRLVVRAQERIADLAHQASQAATNASSRQQGDLAKQDQSNSEAQAQSLALAAGRQRAAKADQATKQLRISESERRKLHSVATGLSGKSAGNAWGRHSGIGGGLVMTLDSNPIIRFDLIRKH